MNGKKYFIQLYYYNPVTHETDWYIEGENGEIVHSEDIFFLIITPKILMSYWMNTEK